VRQSLCSSLPHPHLVIEAITLKAELCSRVLWVGTVVSSPGLSEEDVRVALEAVKRLREEEKKLLEEMARMGRYYYLGYLPIILRVVANK